MNSFDLWLRRQVLKLEHEISTNPTYESNSTPTRDELMELRRLTVIHRFLNSNLQDDLDDKSDKSGSHEVDFRDVF